MPPTEPPAVAPRALAEELKQWISQTSGDDAKAKKPRHRIKFVWPPHPVSYSFHVLASDWTGSAELEANGERFAVEVARTPHGVFGRSEALWLEARGESDDAMLQNMALALQPYFIRQNAIRATLDLPTRFNGVVRSLTPIQWLKLLYCEDRDVANDAQVEIERHASSERFTQALIAILEDRRHPDRRSAQWCVLDMFEDLPAFCQTQEHETHAVAAIRGLIWDAEDDYARTVFKAGVVLGGHIPHKHGGPTLLECLKSPSPIGRRSAIHGLFHVVEWMPAMKGEVVEALRRVGSEDSLALLRDYAKSMADDIEAENVEHVQEPLFENEP